MKRLQDAPKPPIRRKRGVVGTRGSRDGSGAVTALPDVNSLRIVAMPLKVND